MTGVEKLTGAAPNLGKYWIAINCKKVKAEVKRLQMRIAKAVREGKKNTDSTRRSGDGLIIIKFVQSARTFSYADTFIYHSLRRWARRRHSNKGPRWIKNKYFNQSGRKWVFSCKIKDKKGKKKILELIKPSSTKVLRYIKIKETS